MKFKFLAGLFPVLLLAVSAWRFSQPQATSPAPAVAAVPASPRLTDDQVSGYTPFDIGQTFTLPAGPKGMEFSPVAKALEGKKVRISGRMVRHAHDDAAVFLLTTFPLTLNMVENGLADDLPQNAVHVILPVLPGMAPDWVRQPLVVYGTLSLGPRQELDGRISEVRLAADFITAADGRTIIEPRRSIMLQPARLSAGKVKLQTLSAQKTE
jgi:hypothetical protein